MSECTTNLAAAIVFTHTALAHVEVAWSFTYQYTQYPADLLCL
jgi:hypothetical protein